MSSMLSRGGSNAPSRPERSKSTPSFRPRTAVSINDNSNDSETSHQDALTAANLAYERAYERKSARKGVMRGERELEPNDAGDGRPRLGRRQSVRFVGPNAIPTRTRSITRRQARGYKADHESHRQSLQPHMANSSLLFNGDSITALPEEFGETFLASEPSSYRRLRKAKSMFNPDRTASTVLTNQPPKRTGHLQRRSQHSSDAPSDPIRFPDHRLKRSYSFLRGVTDKLSTGNRQYATHDAAIQLARDTYLQDLEQQKLKEQSSFLNSDQRYRAQKTFRRTVRTSSTNSYGTAVSSPLPLREPEKTKGIGSKARSISQTLREKMKRVFKRPSNSKGIPAQHLDAAHQHYGGYAPSFHGSVQQYPSFPEPNAEILRQVGSRESSLYERPAIVGTSPCPGSIRSVSSGEDENNDKSRVTSWTNSTAANTVDMPIYMERKRLSIIKEDGGPHQSSSSTEHYDDPGDGYTKFRQPVKQGGPDLAETKRIFSALQREINQRKQKVTLDDGHSGKDMGFDSEAKHHSLLIPGGNSSNRLNIRRINTTPETSLTFDFAGQIDGKKSLHQAAVEDYCESCQEDDKDLLKNLTPQNIADMNEHRMPGSRHPLREVKSAFFPPSMRIERSNTSPFRRSMYAGSEDEDAVMRSRFAERRLEIGTRMQNSSIAGSESIYSRSSSDQFTKAAASSLSLARTESNGEAGTAVIITSRSLTQGTPARPDCPQRSSSANSSGEWKRFVTTQVASLETTRRPHSHMNDLSVKGSSHRKESAQLNGDDVMIGTLRTPNAAPNQPLGIIQGNIISRSRLIEDERSLMDDSSLAGQVMNRNDENIPATPPSASSRKHFKLQSETIPPFPMKKTPNGLRQRPSQASLNSQKGIHKASTTKSPRSSVERTERLRRLKSSSSAMLRKTPSGNDNKGTNDTTTSPDQESEDLEAGPIATYSHAGKNHKLVDSFLKDRRSQMRISEESGIEHAFL